MRKERQQPAKIWEEHVLKTKTKSHNFWASWGKKFLNSSCEFGYPGLGSDKVKPSGIRRVSLHEGEPFHSFSRICLHSLKHVSSNRFPSLNKKRNNSYYF